MRLENLIFAIVSKVDNLAQRRLGRCNVVLKFGGALLTQGGAIVRTRNLGLSTPESTRRFGGQRASLAALGKDVGGDEMYRLRSDELKQEDIVDFFVQTFTKPSNRQQASAYTNTASALVAHSSLLNLAYQPFIKTFKH